MLYNVSWFSRINRNATEGLAKGITSREKKESERLDHRNENEMLKKRKEVLINPQNPKNIRIASTINTTTLIINPLLPSRRNHDFAPIIRYRR